MSLGTEGGYRSPRPAAADVRVREMEFHKHRAKAMGPEPWQARKWSLEICGYWKWSFNRNPSLYCCSWRAGCREGEMHAEETVFLACLVFRSGLGWLIAHLLVIKDSLGWKVMQLEIMHLCKFYKFISWLLHVILIQCGNASYILSNHPGPDTSVMKNRRMVQKLTSVINVFLLFRPLVNGPSMSTRLKNKPELCLNCTKSWSTGRSYFVVGLFCQQSVQLSPW